MLHSEILDIKNIPKLSIGEGPFILVDDDLAQIELVKICYSKSNRENELISFDSGYKLIEYLKLVKNNLTFMPSIILLDINMPEINGFETLEKIFEDRDFAKNLVIVMFSASSDILDQKRALQLGAKAYLSKPTEIEDYISMIEKI